MRVNRKDKHFTILGGGFGGLAAAYYLHQSGQQYALFESADRTGGHCVTFRHGDFLFDSGAHRIHGQDPAVLQEFRKLLGCDMITIDMPSQIFGQGKRIRFPLSPFNLLRLGLGTVLRIFFEVMQRRISGRREHDHFEAYARWKYGRTLSERFLLNYSEKLWGMPCRGLSTAIAGKRLKGLNLKAFLLEAMLGEKYASHVEGSFFYPRKGIGQLSEALAEASGRENIHCNAEITGIRHRGGRIHSVQVNGNRWIGTDEVISTLPLNQLIEMLEPQPPERILELAGSLKFRDIILVAFFLHVPSVTQAATLYFPDKNILFTRVYEPRNRSPWMSPEGATSLVAEISCSEGDAWWRMSDQDLIRRTQSQLVENGLIQMPWIDDTCVKRLHHTYPILELGYEAKVSEILSYLKGFRNLKMTGRNGLFIYSWMHDMMRLGEELAKE